MSKPFSEEIFRQEGDPFRSVRVTLEADGGLMLDAQDMGQLVEELFGDSDYEFWVRIPSRAASQLAYALLKKHFAGRERAVDELRELCVAEKIPHESASWK